MFLGKKKAFTKEKKAEKGESRVSLFSSPEFTCQDKLMGFLLNRKITSTISKFSETHSCPIGSSYGKCMS